MGLRVGAKVGGTVALGCGVCVAVGGRGVSDAVAVAGSGVDVAAACGRLQAVSRKARRRIVFRMRLLYSYRL